MHDQIENRIHLFLFPHLVSLNLYKIKSINILVFTQLNREKRKTFKMKLILLILTTYFTLSFASPLTASSIIDPLSQLLYIQLNPVFQNTLQQLTQLVYGLAEKLSQIIEHRSVHSKSILPAPWVTQLFGGMNSISTQWNNHVTDFFTNIPTIFEKTGRSLLNFSIIKNTLHEAVSNLLEVLKKLFFNNINQSLISIINEFNLITSHRGEFDLDAIINTFQQESSNVFGKTTEQLNRTVDDAIDIILMYWNDLKFLG
jgi:hypothetical protein